MPLIFDSPAVPSALVNPKDLKLDLLRGQDYESDGTTLRTATYNGADILLDGSPIVTVANVKALDLTFDNSDNALIVYTDMSDNVHLYDDSDQSTTDFAVTGQDPRIHNDRQAEPMTVITYRRTNDVLYRDSTDDFSAEAQVDDGSPLQVRTLTGAALGTNDRFQFRGLPVATAPDSTGSGSGSIAVPPSVFDMALLGVISDRPK